jgi:hypothetical protein
MQRWRAYLRLLAALILGGIGVCLLTVSCYAAESTHGGLAFLIGLCCLGTGYLLDYTTPRFHADDE